MSKTEELEADVALVNATLFGRPGHPDEALVVIVKENTKQLNKLAGSMNKIARFFWALGLVGSGLIVERIWALMINVH